jgi:diguanylate cyclase (GGDEF)-like protein
MTQTPRDVGQVPKVSRPSTILRSADHLEELWESRVGRALRRVGLKSVRTTILTLAVLATLIPALATSLISYRQNRRAIQAKLHGELTSSSTQSAREVGLWIKERIYDLRVFAASYEVIEGIERGGTGSRRLPEYLSSVNERFPDYEQLMVVAPDQRTVASSGRTPGRLHFTGDWLQQARLGDPVLGDPQRADSSTTITMEVAVPIMSANGRFLGLLAGRLRFNGIEGPLDSLRPGNGGRVLVARADGQVIVSIGAAMTALPEPMLRRLERSAGRAVTYDGADGIPVLGVTSEVGRSDWRVVAEVPADAAFSDIRALRNTTIVLVLVLLLVVFALAYGLGLLIVLPLERLSHAAARVAGGDLEVDVPASSGGEVGALATVFNDMVRRLRHGRAELERLSVTDELTGLANRRRLTAELEREALRSERNGRTFAVLMLDVDRFKVFNDTYGHPAGDAVLKRLARVLRDNAREMDTVARYGGEEFLLILPETDAATAAIVAERIRASAERDRFAPDGSGTEVNVTLSIGYALFPMHANTHATLIEAADKALYRSKQAGRNQVHAAEGSVTPPATTEPPKAKRRKA